MGLICAQAIATEELVKLENEGYRVVPTARAAKLTMDREGAVVHAAGGCLTCCPAGIRTLATDIKLQTSPYRSPSSTQLLLTMLLLLTRFAATEAQFKAAVSEIG